MKLSLIFAGAVACEGVVVGYYAPWNKLAVEDVPYKKLTHVLFSFGFLHLNGTGKFIDTDIEIKTERKDGDISSKEKLQKMAKLGKEHGTKVLLSVGGWTGSKSFSDICADPYKRKKFTNNAMDLIKEYGLDGIDLDWEFPGSRGNGNSFSPSDAENLLELATHMRRAFDKRYGNGKLLTASVPAHPYTNSRGERMGLSGFAKAFHFVNIMGYSLMGAWSDSTGPNAPLYTSAISMYSLNQTIMEWKNTGFPANQINAGFAFFGSIQHSQGKMSNSIYAPSNKEKNQPKPPAVLDCEKDAYSSDVFSYGCLRKRILASPTEANPESGFSLNWDAASHTPWLYHSETKLFVSFDNPRSIAAKVCLARRHRLLGVMLWDITQDHDGELIYAATNTKCPKYKG
ncbi:hypothetical protein DSO57_1002418 [Entomophthora muscae]|uniref:Uncharacterized protein n=1 Tax=Entomophthora muscae TaxID=34485 RepID=A0ACC2SAR4_9FUNG|nr:hypothetical protein DSO57_1002418 [Entomophthora muscae]